MARTTLGDLQSRKRPFEPENPSAIDPSKEVDYRFPDPIRDMINKQYQGTPVQPGYQERFGDPSKVISQGVPPSLNQPMPKRVAGNLPEGWQYDDEKPLSHSDDEASAPPPENRPPAPGYGFNAAFGPKGAYPGLDRRMENAFGPQRVAPPRNTDSGYEGVDFPAAADEARAAASARLRGGTVRTAPPFPDIGNRPSLYEPELRATPPGRGYFYRPFRGQ